MILMTGQRDRYIKRDTAKREMQGRMRDVERLGLFRIMHS